MWRELDQRERELDQLAEVSEELLHLKAELAWVKAMGAEAVVVLRKAKMRIVELLRPGGGLIIESTCSVPVELVCLNTNFYMQFGIWTKVKTLGSIENPNNFTEKAISISIVMDEFEIEVELLERLLQVKKVITILDYLL